MDKWQNGDAEAKKVDLCSPSALPSLPVILPPVVQTSPDVLQAPPDVLQTPDCLVIQNGGHKIMNGNGEHNGSHVPYESESLMRAKPDVTTTEVMVAADDDEDTLCGLCSFMPSWLQPLANKKIFLALFCLTSVLQGMYYTYFVSVLTTIEKIYQIPSKTTGIIMAATEIGQIGGSMILTYYGGQGHRPKWIACGMIVFALASILCSTPHYIFGGQVVPPVKYSAHENVKTATLKRLQRQACPVALINNTGWSNSSSLSSTQSAGSSVLPSTVMEAEFVTSRRLLYDQEASDSDGADIKAKARNSEITQIVLVVFFFSLLFIGIGATAVNTLGIPFIDDNVATKESPLYFGTTIGVRILGPVFGFLLGSFCTSVYVNFPFESSQVSRDDPQWIGAWWLGVIIVGIALLVASIPMMAFPRKLPNSIPKGGEVVHSNGKANGVATYPQVPQHQKPLLGKQAQKKKHTNPSLKDFPAAVRRLLENKILLCRTASNVLHILPIAGFYTFLPKFLESQFQLTATIANMTTGIAGILVMGIGIFASGYVMRKFKPSPRFVALWIAICALAYSLGMVILMWFGCPINQFVGLNAGSDELEVKRETCRDICNCKPNEFAPVCSSDGVTYMSPCLAGCTKVRDLENDQYLFSDCLCLNETMIARNGYCPLNCNNLVWYVSIFSFFVLIHSTSEVGSMMLTLRCVERNDKAMALGLVSVAIGLFGNVPCPIMYGAVVDSACLFWENNFGQPGACRVYDPTKFRKLFHGMTAIIMFAAFIVDLLVYFKAFSIQFHDEEGEPKKVVVQVVAEKTVPNSIPVPQLETTAV